MQYILDFLTELSKLCEKHKMIIDSSRDGVAIYRRNKKLGDLSYFFSDEKELIVYCLLDSKKISDKKCIDEMTAKSKLWEIELDQPNQTNTG